MKEKKKIEIEDNGLTIDSTELFDYIGKMPEHTLITLTDMIAIFKIIFYFPKE